MAESAKDFIINATRFYYDNVRVTSLTMQHMRTELSLVFAKPPPYKFEKA